MKVPQILLWIPEISSTYSTIYLGFAQTAEEELYMVQKRSVSVNNLARFGLISKVMAIFRKQLEKESMEST